jgi:AcrR family transcriptional regulator
LQAFIDECIEEGLTEEEIEEAIADNFELLESDESEDELTEEEVEYLDSLSDDELESLIAESIDEETDEEDEAEELVIDMSEAVDALLEGEDLSEEFRTKATTIFEAAVIERVQQETARIEDAYVETLEAQVAEIHEQLSENVDDYLNYVVENWVSDNEVAIETGLRTELTEQFISGLQQLFAENYIEIPEEKVPVVEELQAKIHELEDSLNEEIESNVTMNKILTESVRAELIEAGTDGLTEVQADKLRSLSEGVEFTDQEQFAEKIITLRENYFSNTPKAKGPNETDEQVADGSTFIAEEAAGLVGAAARVLSKQTTSK